MIDTYPCEPGSGAAGAPQGGCKVLTAVALLPPAARRAVRWGAAAASQAAARRRVGHASPCPPADGDFATALLGPCPHLTRAARA